ncbi:hypothetical protein Sm713_05040 [Streptomyces sp. TS71-3]|nr:hypothetical protein Sm713_05040 [Streptomyces sp. TS71-3]
MRSRTIRHAVAEDAESPTSLMQPSPMQPSLMQRSRRLPGEYALIIPAYSHGRLLLAPGGRPCDGVRAEQPPVGGTDRPRRCERTAPVLGRPGRRSRVFGSGCAACLCGEAPRVFPEQGEAGAWMDVTEWRGGGGRVAGGEDRAGAPSHAVPPGKADGR